jgi:hypothetical protein
MYEETLCKLATETWTWFGGGGSLFLKIEHSLFFVLRLNFDSNLGYSKTSFLFNLKIQANFLFRKSGSRQGGSLLARSLNPPPGEGD